MPKTTNGRIGRNTVSAYVRRTAIAKGILGGSKGWLALGGVFWFANFMRRNLGRTEVYVTREVLRPGDTVTIRTIPALTRSQRKAGKKAS